MNGSLFFVSIPDHNSRYLGVESYNKFYNAKISGEAGLSPKVVQYLPDQRVLVLEFLPIAVCSAESLQCLAVQHRLVHTMKMLHGGASFWQDFDMFRLIEFYMKIVKDRELVLPAGYADYKEQVWGMGEALAPYWEKIVPCHNDLVPENVMDDGYRVLLIDFDYSGNNDPCFDLGSISTEAGYDDAQVRELARAYYGLVSEKIVARIHLHSILGDVGWSLWSVIQAKILDIDFNEYGLTRWNRAVERMDPGEFERWLRKVRSKK